MRLSTRSRYGMRLMFRLALHYKKKPLLLRQIAADEEISEKYLSQIIIPLRAAGLVRSARGAHGGYSMARPPDQITVRRIVETIEGDLTCVECVREPKACGRSARCAARRVWEKLAGGINRVLESITLDDLLKDHSSAPEKNPIYHI